MLQKWNLLFISVILFRFRVWSNVVKRWKKGWHQWGQRSLIQLGWRSSTSVTTRALTSVLDICISYTDHFCYFLDTAHPYIYVLQKHLIYFIHHLHHKTCRISYSAHRPIVPLTFAFLRFEVTVVLSVSWCRSLVIHMTTELNQRHTCSQTHTYIWKEYMRILLELYLFGIISLTDTVNVIWRLQALVVDGVLFSSSCINFPLIKGSKVSGGFWTNNV
jgi:hypothetical protein